MEDGNIYKWTIANSTSQMEYQKKKKTNKPKTTLRNKTKKPTDQTQLFLLVETKEIQSADAE